MGTTASAQPAKTSAKSPGLQQGRCNDSTSSASAITSKSPGGNIKNNTSASLTDSERAAQERKEYLKQKLRSKIRAIAAFRKSVQVAEDCQGSSSGGGGAADEFSDGDEEGNTGDAEERGRKASVDFHSLDILYHPSNNREHLRDFLWKRKQETKACWDFITDTMDDDINDKYSIHDKKMEGEGGGGKAAGGKVERRKGEKIPDEIRLPPTMAKVENDSVCDLCNEMAAFSIPCRVCTRVYHRKCLEKSGRYRDEDSKLIDRSTTEEGWSCYNCDNLSLLLSAEETAEMMEDFDIYDINRDESISIVEFVRFKKQQYEMLDGHSMPEEEEQLVRAQFDRMDTDGNGEVDWWEFMRFEARRFLARKSEVDLAAMLTPKELLVARSVYLAFINGKELEYTYFQGVFLGSGIETWDEFLRDQALYMLWSRANRDHSLVI